MATARQENAQPASLAEVAVHMAAQSTGSVSTVSVVSSAAVMLVELRAPAPLALAVAPLLVALQAKATEAEVTAGCAKVVALPAAAATEESVVVRAREAVSVLLEPQAGTVAVTAAAVALVLALMVARRTSHQLCLSLCLL